MTEKNKSDQQTQDVFLNSLYWWGVPTLFRAPYNTNPGDCDIGLVGVPHSTGNGTTERDQHLGPRAVRDVSAFGRRVHMDFQLDPWNACSINDLGDVPLPEGNNNERSIEHITQYYQRLDTTQTRPVSIGGDHSITGGILQAIAGANSKLSGGEKAVLLHIDAHTDVFRICRISSVQKNRQHTGDITLLNRVMSMRTIACKLVSAETLEHWIG